MVKLYEGFCNAVCNVVDVGEEFAVEDIIKSLSKRYQQPFSLCTRFLLKDDRFEKVDENMENIGYYSQRKRYTWRRIS